MKGDEWRMFSIFLKKITLRHPLLLAFSLILIIEKNKKNKKEEEERKKERKKEEEEERIACSMVDIIYLRHPLRFLLGKSSTIFLLLKGLGLGVPYLFYVYSCLCFTIYRLVADLR